MSKEGKEENTNSISNSTTMTSNNTFLKQIKINSLCKAKWLELNEIEYYDHQGRVRKWESVSRTTKVSDVDGSDIIAIVNNKDDGKKYIILTLQFRPPVNNFVLEFPAGLIDPNETIENASLRELKEETGYQGDKVLLTSPPLPLESGAADCTTKLVIVNIKEDQDNEKEIKQELEDSESIEVILLPFDNLLAHLDDEKNKRNCLINIQLYSFALGMSFKDKFL